MAINESVYGIRENWIVPTTRTEQGTNITGMPSYDNTIDEINRVKIANYNTLESPRTLMRTQMSEDSHAGGYVINNGWLPTQTDTMDNSIVQFGIGPQSGLSNIEWWGEVWTGGTTQPEIGSHNNVEIINTDTYDVTNIAFGFNNTFRPSLYATSGSMAGNGYMNPANWQYLNMQLWGDSRCFYSSQIDVVPQSAYAFASLITQIPIKNIKIYPVIRAYNPQMQSNEYSSIQDYLADKSNYPFIYCIYAKFASNTGETWSSIDVSPWFFNKTSIAKGFGNGDIIRNENIMYLRTRDLSGGFFVIGGCPNFNSQTYYQTNGFYWHYNTASVNFDVAELMPVYQPEDLKFEYDTAKNAFICDVSSMTDDQITEGIRKQLASFGMFFVDNINDLNLPLDDEKTFLGILEDGVGYGKYSHGADNRNQPQWNWDTMEENDYDPENPPTPVMPDNWSDTTNPPYSINKTPLPNKWYTCPPAAIPNIMNAVNSIDLENLDKSNTFGLNPIDGIIAIRKMFFNNVIAENFLSGDIVGAITIGVIQVQPEGGIANAIIRHTSNAPYTYIPVTGYPVGEKSELRDFRSYLPYTSCMFYDAFCGSIEVDPAKILNKYITITQTVDFLNGDKITSLYASEIPSNIGERIAMLSGKCCEDVPLNGNRTADYLRNKYILSQEYKQSQWNAISRSAMGAGGASISGISGNVIGAATQAVGTLANTMMAGISSETVKTQMTHLVPSVSKINAGTSNVEAGVVSGPTLFLYLPKMNENYDQLLYGNLTGFAGYKVVKPKDLSAGTHIFSHPKVSISGTKNEAYMLVDQLQKGIIIK